MSRRTVLLISAALLASAAVPSLAAPKDGPRYDVTIRMTEYGIPHIKAKDYGSLGYGYGYSVAGAAICTLAETYVTVRAERSRYFGPDGGYTYRANGSTVNNLNSDLFYQQIIDDQRIEKLLAQTGPGAPKPQIREAVR